MLSILLCIERKIPVVSALAVGLARVHRWRYELESDGEGMVWYGYFERTELAEAIEELRIATES